MASRQGVPAPFTNYYFGYLKFTSAQLPEPSEDDEEAIVLWREEPEVEAPDTNGHTDVPPPKPTPKSPWGAIPNHGDQIHRKNCRGWFPKKPIAEVVQNLKLDYTPMLFHPRGLQNKDTKCFLNCTVQTLVACPPVYRLLRNLSRSDYSTTEYPVLHRLIRLINEFDPVDSKTREAIFRGEKLYNPTGPILIPTYLYELLKDFNPIASDWQEDMHEFLLFLVDKLHCELLDVAALNPITEEEADKDRLNVADEWAVVGKGNKSAVVVTDVSKFKKSIISYIFEGQMQSEVRRKVGKASAALEPFFCLHLDIAPLQVSTLEDAINFHLAKEKLDDLQEGAYKENRINMLPPVLLIHLKRFAYIAGKGIEKVPRQIFYPEVLTIRPSWTASSFTRTGTYNLQAVTRHLGKRPHGGHYTCFVKHGINEWLHFDDSSVHKIDLEDVLDEPDAYVLMYIRNNSDN